MPDLDPEAEALDRFYREFARRVRAARKPLACHSPLWSGWRRCTRARCRRSSAARPGDLGLVEAVRIAGALAVPVADLIPAVEPHDEPPRDEPGRPRGIVQWD